MDTPRTQGCQTCCVILGLLETGGVGLWCLAGAGIYGSPLALMSSGELAYVFAFFLTGPLSAFLASLIVEWSPRWAARWLMAGGLVSGVLALRYLGTDAFVLPLLLGSAPMLLMGWWLKRIPPSVNGAKGVRTGASVPGIMKVILAWGAWGLVGILSFLVAVIWIFALFTLLAILNPMGLRGTPNPPSQGVDRPTLADAIGFLIIAAVGVAMTLWRKRLRLRWETIAGTWIGLLACGISVAISLLDRW